MTTRVINDPSAVGWVFDPSSGRWLWEGSSGGGGGGTGGDDPRISDTEITNWNTSFSWGNHADAGYLESETDPTVPDHVKAITTVDIANWNAGTGGGGSPSADPRISNEQIVHWDLAYSWGDHADAGYLEVETDPVFTASPAYGISQSDINKWNAGTGDGSGGGGGEDPRITDGQIDNWDDAYNWGDHGAQGYATQSWVNSQGYATTTWVSQNYQPAGSYLTASSLSGYATESWVTGKGYLTSASLNGYATTTWVSQNYQAKGSYAAANHNHSGVYQPAGSYAASNHSHSEYAASNHNHSGVYAPNSHSHNYAATNHSHTEYAAASHSHAYVPTSGNTTISGTLTATDFVASSDASKKKNVVTAPIGLIEQLRGVEFEWKDTGEGASGVIAQEVQQVLPHLVHEGEDGLSVSYMGLIAYLIEEIKDMRQTIEAMK